MSYSVSAKTPQDLERIADVYIQRADQLTRDAGALREITNRYKDRAEELRQL